MAQIYPGTSQVAQNRRNFCNPDYELEKLREMQKQGTGLDTSNL